MGQCALNDHPREQPCKFGSELKGGRALIRAASCMSVTNESPKRKSINSINQQSPAPAGSITLSKHEDVEQQPRPRCSGGSLSESPPFCCVYLRGFFSLSRTLARRVAVTCMQMSAARRGEVDFTRLVSRTQRKHRSSAGLTTDV